ncbi:hypothetical protein BGZ91_008340, partial [Linnemannia elongata]
MERALKSVPPGTHIFNCLWHVSKNLDGAAGARRRVMETDLTDLEGMGAQLKYQEASGDDEQNHDQAFAQGSQRDDRKGNGDRYMGNSREEGEEVDDTVPHEVCQLAYQDILSCWAKTMSRQCTAS